MNATFASFYQELYKSESMVSKHAYNEFLNNIKLPRFSNDISITLDGQIKQQECEAAIKDMRKGKSPGPDGIPHGFSLSLWPLVGPLLLDMIQYSREGSFSRNVNK